MFLDEEGKCGFEYTHEEIAVLKNVPSSNHIDLNEDPNHQPHTESRPEIACNGMSAEGENPGEKLPDAVDEKENDAWNEKGVKRRILQHLGGHVHKTAGWQ